MGPLSGYVECRDVDPSCYCLHPRTACDMGEATNEVIESQPDGLIAGKATCSHCNRASKTPNPRSSCTFGINSGGDRRYSSSCDAGGYGGGSSISASSSCSNHGSSFGGNCISSPRIRRGRGSISGVATVGSLATQRQNDGQSRPSSYNNNNKPLRSGLRARFCARRRRAVGSCDRRQPPGLFGFEWISDWCCIGAFLEPILRSCTLGIAVGIAAKLWLHSVHTQIVAFVAALVSVLQARWLDVVTAMTGVPVSGVFSRWVSPAPPLPGSNPAALASAQAAFLWPLSLALHYLQLLPQFFCFLRNWRRRIEPRTASPGRRRPRQICDCFHEHCTLQTRTNSRRWINTATYGVELPNASSSSDSNGTRRRVESRVPMVITRAVRGRVALVYQVYKATPAMLRFRHSSLTRRRRAITAVLCSPRILRRPGHSVPCGRANRAILVSAGPPVMLDPTNTFRSRVSGNHVLARMIGNRG